MSVRIKTIPTALAIPAYRSNIILRNLPRHPILVEWVAPWEAENLSLLVIPCEIIDLDYEDYHQEVAMNAIPGIRMKNPAHPGGFVKSEIVEALDLSVTDAAKALG